MYSWSWFVFFRNLSVSQNKSWFIINILFTKNKVFEVLQNVLKSFTENYTDEELFEIYFNLIKLGSKIDLKINTLASVDRFYQKIGCDNIRKYIREITKNSKKT